MFYNKFFAVVSSLILTCFSVQASIIPLVCVEEPLSENKNNGIESYINSDCTHQILEELKAMNKAIDDELGTGGDSEVVCEEKESAAMDLGAKWDGIIEDIQAINAMIDDAFAEDIQGKNNNSKSLDLLSKPTKEDLIFLENSKKLENMRVWYQGLLNKTKPNPRYRVAYLSDFFGAGEERISCYGYHSGWNHIFDLFPIIKYEKNSRNLYHISRKLSELTIVHFDSKTRSPDVKRFRYPFLSKASFLEIIGGELAILSVYSVPEESVWGNFVTFLSKDNGNVVVQRELPSDIGYVNSMARYGNDHFILISTHHDRCSQQWIFNRASLQFRREMVIQDISFSCGYRIATNFQGNEITVSASYMEDETILVASEGRLLSKPRMAGNILIYQSSRNFVTAIDLNSHKKIYDVSVENKDNLIPLIMTDGNESSILLRLGNVFRYIEYDDELDIVTESDLLVVDKPFLYTFSFDAKRKRLWGINNCESSHDIECWDLVKTSKLFRVNGNECFSGVSGGYIKLLGFCKDGTPILSIEGQRTI